MPDLKDEIVNKSFFQFLNRGYKACSLKDLEKATGLTKGAFYYYFRNKEEILKAGIEKYLSVVSEISEEEFLEVGSLKAYIDIVVARKERRAEQLQQMFDFFIIDIAFFQLVLEVAPLFPEYRKWIDELSKDRLSRWEYMILKAKQQGEIKGSLDTSVLARNLMSVSTSMLNIGFKAVRLSDIERAAKITRGTFYYHFTNKEEVLKEGLYSYYALLNSKRTEEFGHISTLREYVDLTIQKLTGIHNYSARTFSSEIPEILCLSLIVEVIALFPEFKKVVLASKMLRLSKLEQLILNAKRAGELRNDVDTSILAKNLLNISVGVINYLIMHQDISYALSAVRSQYEQLYSLAVGE